MEVEAVLVARPQELLAVVEGAHCEDGECCWLLFPAAVGIVLVHSLPGSVDGSGEGCGFGVDPGHPAERCDGSPAVLLLAVVRPVSDDQLFLCHLCLQVEGVALGPSYADHEAPDLLLDVVDLCVEALEFAVNGWPRVLPDVRGDDPVDVGVRRGLVGVLRGVVRRRKGCEEGVDDRGMRRQCEGPCTFARRLARDPGRICELWKSASLVHLFL